VLELVDCFLMQSDADATRIITMGAPSDRVRVVGSLKWDASLLTRPSADELAALTRRLGLGADEHLIVAGSTHRGEEEALLEAFGTIRTTLNHVKLIIAPRHLERVGEVEQLIRQHGASGQRISRLLDVPQAWDVAIVDSLGQLATYYALATVVFVGGSLIPHGGQNPIEPASLGKPVVFGPSMENFAEIVQQLLAHQGAHQLKDRAELTTVLHGLLANREDANLMGARSQALVERLKGTSQKTLEALQALLTAVS
jgi:3-deoxy-D-manno-octulosonic-acid transferase